MFRINTVKLHQRSDPEFGGQVREAQEEGIQLLNRLRIEMLRAHMPSKFKTPGTKVAISTGTVLEVAAELRRRHPA